MKLSVTKSVGRLSLELLSLLSSSLLASASITYLPNGVAENNGITTGFPSPMIDATTFINRGVFGVSSTFPYETRNTLNFTNKVGFFPSSGTMSGSVGWNFEFVPPIVGQRQMAANFFNGPGATIQSVSSIGISNAFFNAGTVVTPSYLFVSSTNIVNRGSLFVGPNGWLRLQGQEVDLSRSIVAVAPVWEQPIGSFNGTETFFPDVAVSDIYWASATEDDPFVTASLWNGVTAFAPPHEVTFAPPPGFDGVSSFVLLNPVSDSHINSQTIVGTVEDVNGDPVFVSLESNVVKQAAFVGLPPGMTAQIGFTPSTENENRFQTIGVLLSMTLSNLATSLPEAAYIYIEDKLGSESERGLLANPVSINGAFQTTFRPTNYIVHRLPTFPGLPGNHGVPEPTFFLTSGQTDPLVIGDTLGEGEGVPEEADYTAYSALFDNLVSRTPFLPSGTVSNLPGRVQIYADNLNLDRARIRGEGHILIKTPHLVSSTNTVIDGENLSLFLGSTNGNLNVQGLAKDGVVRLRGSIRIWSAVWESEVVVRIENFDDGEPDILEDEQDVQYHVLMIDATTLQTVLPVTVFDFTANSANVVINDNMAVAQSFFISGQSLTINGVLSLTSVVLPNAFGVGVLVSVPDWVSALAPNLLHFTNNGTLNVLNEAHFGDDRTTPYSNFINTGTINAASIAVNSIFFRNTGTMIASNGPMTIQSVTGQLEGGTNFAAGDMLFAGNSLSINNHGLAAGGGIDFYITDSLFDGGPGAANYIGVRNGFNLFVKPFTGDLLGTTIETVAPTLAVVNHVWAGEDRLATASGYVNNVALGRLKLTSQTFDPFFLFSGAGVQNGLYVDVLDLSGLDGNFLNQIQINSNLRIYFASVILPAGFVVPPGQTPEEFMNGQFGGRLIWNQAFAGPASAAAVVINGQTHLMNTALVNSQNIDSDGDGIPNASDPEPFANVPWNLPGFASETFVTIESPSADQSFNNPMVALQGAAGDISGGTHVYYRLNNGNWTPAASADGALWAGVVRASPGQNEVRVYAVGSTGNTSATGSVHFVYTPTAPLTVNVIGSGTVSPNYNGALLELGKSYNVTAHAAPGHAFSGWTGHIVSGSAHLTFVMESNLVLTANFIPQPFAAAADSYNGLFYEADDVRLGRSGAFSAVTTSRGTYTGTLQIGMSRHAFSGQFDASGAATNTIVRKGAPPLELVLQMHPDNSRITGSASSGIWIAALEAHRAAFNAGSNPAPFADSHTVVFPGTDDNSGAPQGDGYGAIALDGSGKVHLAGVLADGTKLIRTATLSSEGQWPLYAALYSGQGQVLGWLTFSNTAESDLTGWIHWTKPANIPSKYPAGFAILNTNVTGSVYDPLASPILDFNSVVFSGENLLASFTNDVTVGSRNQVFNTSSNQLTLKLNPAKGLFKGSVVDPNSGRKIDFNGAVLQKQNSGAGFFLEANQSGKVSLEP